MKRAHIIVFLSAIFFLSITILGFHSVRAQQSDPSPSPSAEQIGTRHVSNHRLIDIAGALKGYSSAFGFLDRMGDDIAPELAEYYNMYMILDILNLPEDAQQQYFQQIQRSEEDDSDDEWRLSNIDRDKCYENPFENFFSECVTKSTQGQTSKTYSSVLAAVGEQQHAYREEIDQGQGMLAPTAPTNILDMDGESMVAGQVFPSGAVLSKFKQALDADLHLRLAQHGVPGDVGSDPAGSLPSIGNGDSQNLTNPSHGPIDNNPQISDDFGTGDENPFDDWSNFDSQPWMDSTQQQMQQTLNDFGDIGGGEEGGEQGRALACLSPPARLAAVADILGTAEVQRLMRADTENINCQQNIPRTINAPPSNNHDDCVPARAVRNTVVDTALILGLPNQHNNVTAWNVYLWPEDEGLTEYTGGVFGGSCVWTVSANDGTGTSVAFIGNDQNIGLLQQIQSP